MASRFVAQWCPPVLRRLGNRMLGGATRYAGPYATWDEATRATGGYAQHDILDRVVRATEAVLAGRAEYEQDGQVRHGTPPPSHSLEALLSCAALEHGRLHVIDFGGGLASHYLRWRPMLESLPDLHWCVVEQPHFVETGNRLFEHIAQVSFAGSIEEAMVQPPNAILASGVLQYLPEPDAMLARLAETGARTIVLDRLPVLPGADARAVAQHVPASLGRASYPLWFFPPTFAQSHLGDRYVRTFEFDSGDAAAKAGALTASYKGSVWMRRR